MEKKEVGLSTIFKMNANALSSVRNKFTDWPDNWERLFSWWKTDAPISFYSWECPPRQVQESPQYGRWVNFDLNLETIVKGNKLDQYTELPRLTTQPEQENWFIQTVVKKNNQATYTKIVADTNATYLFIKSGKILGEKKIAALSKKFRALLEKEANRLLGKNAPPIILFTALQKDFKAEYDLFFNLVCQSFQGNQSRFVPQPITRAWQKCLLDHIGLTKKDKAEKSDVLGRIIASYAAEGMIFELISQTGILPNPVWVNWEEELNLAQTTDVLRKRYGLESMPKLYFVKK